LARKQLIASDCDSLKQLEIFTAGAFLIFPETKQFQNGFETVLFQFRFSFVSVLL